MATNPQADIKYAVEAQHIEQLSAAADANSHEHGLKFWQALRFYPIGVIWSLAMSTVIIMEGFDTKLVGTLFAQPTFQKTFGRHLAAGKYEIPAPWQAGLNCGSGVGQLAGMFVAGYLTERYGFQRTMLVGQVSIVGCIFIQLFAGSLQVLLVGQLLFAFGQLLVVGVLRCTLNRTDHWAFRIPFALQWTWPALLVPVIYFAPESPWWLVRVNRLEDAKISVKRITSSHYSASESDNYVAMMVMTTKHEREVNSNATYWSCFQGTNLRRTIIVIFVYVTQTLNGNPLRGYTAYFLEQAGLPVTQAFNLTLAGYAIAIVSGIESWTLLPLAGRRTIYITSLLLMTVIMALIGGLGIPQANSSKSAYSWAIGSLLVASSFLYYGTIGPLTNTICAELPSTILRSKSIALARGVYTVSSIAANIITPYQLNPAAWDWGAKTGFFWMGGCVIALVFHYYHLPEPKNRTTVELDYLFEHTIPARKFSRTPVDFATAVRGEGD